MLAEQEVRGDTMGEGGKKEEEEVTGAWVRNHFHPSFLVQEERGGQGQVFVAPRLLRRRRCCCCCRRWASRCCWKEEAAAAVGMGRSSGVGVVVVRAVERLGTATSSQP